jgi:hypothetical protein
MPERRNSPTSMKSLPVGFEDLMPFVDWALESERERNARRYASDMNEIRRFHDTMAARAEAAIAYLERKRPENFTQADRTLLNMLLSLAEVAPAVTFYDSPQVAGGVDPKRVVPE